jgi:hypothetical protein
MNEQQFIPEGMQQELDRRIQAARGNLAAVRQELEQQLKSLGAQQATQPAQSPEAQGTNGEIALLRGELLYLDSLAEHQKSPRPSFGQPRHSGPREQGPVSFGEKWRAAQPTKAHLFWSCLAAVILTIVLGFTWGGWMSAGAAQKMADTAAKAAVVQRLAPICVAQFNQDPAKDEKLMELQGASTYERAVFITDQMWATMPGETEPSSQVAAECAKLLMQIGQ